MLLGTDGQAFADRCREQVSETDARLSALCDLYGGVYPLPYPRVVALLNQPAAKAAFPSPSNGYWVTQVFVGEHCYVSVGAPVDGVCYGLWHAGRGKPGDAHYGGVFGDASDPVPPPGHGERTNTVEVLSLPSVGSL